MEDIAAPLASQAALDVEEAGLFVPGNSNDDEDDDEDDQDGNLRRWFAAHRPSARTEAVVVDSESAPHSQSRLNLEESWNFSTGATTVPAAAMIDPALLQTPFSLPSSSGQAQKRGRPSQDTSTNVLAKKVKKASGSSEQSGIKSNMDWYTENHPHANLLILSTFCQNITLYIQQANSFGPPPHQVLVSLRQQLHQLPFYQGITTSLLEQSSILVHGLKAIWDHPADFPTDMIDFARELHWRWTNSRQSPNVYEGLVSQFTRSGTTSRGWKVDVATIRPQVSSSYIGNGHLLNGQWWPKNLLAMRDGAHGSSMSGIHGTKANGAYSIVLSNFKENTEDMDEGDRITYCGQAGQSGKIPAGTALLLEAYQRGNEIRVLRSAKLPRRNQWRPQRGIRYDGVYKITGFEAVDTSLEQDGTTANTIPADEPTNTAEDEPVEEELVEEKPAEEKPGETKKGKKPKKDKKVIKQVSHRFFLERLPGQSPICQKDSVGARPTAEEIAEYDRADQLNERAFEEAKRQASENARTVQQPEAPFTEDNSPDQLQAPETMTQAEDIEQTNEALIQAAIEATLEDLKARGITQQ